VIQSCTIFSHPCDRERAKARHRERIAQIEQAIAGGLAEASVA
jgi:hypothetical protein